MSWIGGSFTSENVKENRKWKIKKNKWEVVEGQVKQYEQFKQTNKFKIKNYFVPESSKWNDKRKRGKLVVVSCRPKKEN